MIDRQDLPFHAVDIFEGELDHVLKMVSGGHFSPDFFELGPEPFQLSLIISSILETDFDV